MSGSRVTSKWWIISATCLTKGTGTNRSMLYWVLAYFLKRDVVYVICFLIVLKRYFTRKEKAPRSEQSILSSRLVWYFDVGYMRIISPWFYQEFYQALLLTTIECYWVLDLQILLSQRVYHRTAYSYHRKVSCRLWWDCHQLKFSALSFMFANNAGFHDPNINKGRSTLALLRIRLVQPCKTS